MNWRMKLARALRWLCGIDYLIARHDRKRREAGLAPYTASNPMKRTGGAKTSPHDETQS